MGFFNDLVGSFTGSTARKDLAAGKAASDAALAQGQAGLDSQYGKAIDSFTPYAQQGQEANTFYNDVLMNRGDAVSKFSSNPLFSGELAANQMQAQRGGNAAGWGAGKEALAGQRVFSQTAGSWLDRYRDAGQQGFQANAMQANARMGYGDSQWNIAATKAGKATTDANAMAGSRSILSNNLMQAAGAITGGINAWRQPSKIG